MTGNGRGRRTVTTSDLLKILGFYGRFTPSYSRIGYHARRLRWSRLAPDFSGQRWLVTGASGGIGASIAASAARHGAEVTTVARSMDRLEASRGAAGEAAVRIHGRRCDLATVAGIDGLLDALRADGAPFDVLVNNVGVLLNTLSVTDEGFETSYVTNILGHYQLTEGLFHAGLLAGNALIVNMASGGLYNVPLNTRLLNVTDPQRYGGKAAYATHKRAQVALSGLWHQRLVDAGGASYVMHPGWARTEGVRQSLPVFYRLQGALLRSPAEGADTALWLAATRPDDAGEAIWFDRAVRPQHMFPHTREPQCSVQDVVAQLQRDLSAARGTQGA